MAYPQAGNSNNIPGLSQLVNQFNANYAVLNNPHGGFSRTTPARKTLILDNVEMQLIHIINHATGPNAVIKDIAWLAAHRDEIDKALKNFNVIRTNLNLQRNVQLNGNVNTAFNNVGTAYASASNTVGSAKAIRKHAIIGAAEKGSEAFGVGVAATGLSAFSFFGGPIVGAAVTGSVGALSGVGIAAATVYGAVDGAFHGEREVENIIRTGVGLSKLV